MSAKKICAANWKLNLSPQQARQYFKEWVDLRPGPQLNCEAVFFPPAYDLAVAAEVAPAAGFQFGPQNIHCENSGAFTGEISAQAVREMACTYTLIGHSERRTLFNEGDALIAKKVKTALAADLIPMLCIGETLKEREADQTAAVISKQLRAGLAEVREAVIQKPRSSHGGQCALAVAYEPVWAIGTGKVATPEQAEDAHREVRNQLRELLGNEVALQISILYGGSVKPDNAGDLAKRPNVDGFLVGGASLKAKDFFAIAKAL
jgi:triosephosphate isomerase